MPTWNIKPNHKAITAYDAALARYRQHGISHETAVRAVLAQSNAGKLKSRPSVGSPNTKAMSPSTSSEPKQVILEKDNRMTHA